MLLIKPFFEQEILTAAISYDEGILDRVLPHANQRPS